MKKYLLLLLVNIVSASNAFAHGMTEGDKQKIIDAGYMEYMMLGAKHMLTGYDHLLFLFGVIFFLTRFKDILIFITAFTLGHCITLISATLLGIQADYFLIDAVIALTVIYKGFDNVDGFKKYLGVNSPSLVGMVFAFGLIHGFGLSTRLQQLPLGEGGLALVLRILSFNVGVEAGQVIALSVMLFLLSGWRKTESFKTFGKAANVGLMAVGFLLFLMQLHGYQHSTFSDEFPLNKDDHSHVHKDMEEANIKAEKERASQSDHSHGHTQGHDHGDGNVHHH